MIGLCARLTALIGVVALAMLTAAQAAPECKAMNPMACSKYNGKLIMTCVKFAPGRPDCCLEYACRPPYRSRRD